MKRFVGTVLLIVGLVATFITGLDYYQNTESVTFLKTQITLSQADWKPLAVSGGVAIVGLFILATGSSKSRSRARR